MIFDSHSIYRILVNKQNKVIKVKNLQIFEDISAKTRLSLPNFDGKPIFDEVQLSNTKKERLLSRFMTSKDKNKNNEHCQKSMSPPVKCQKSTPLTVKLKQIWVG